MTKRNQFEGKLNRVAEESATMGEVANKIFGLRADENVFDKSIVKIELVKIIPDFAQPRRAVPKKARGIWRGEPDRINEVLANWHTLAVSALGEDIDVVSMIDKFNDGKELDSNIPHVALTYLELVGLAGSIKRDGLNSPITVINRSAPHTIVTGERRFWAYCLLRQYFGDKWNAIPAIVVDGKIDVWQQGAENAKRMSLTAIDLARGIALLIMDMYQGDDGVMFNDINFFDHERDFYAQVANGTRYKIKDGYGQRVQDATGLKSKAQISQYRSLLRLSREHWDAADEDGWTEGYARQFIPRDDERLTTVNHATPVKSDKDLFYDDMKSILRHKIHQSPDMIGLYGLGSSVMFVWWNMTRGGFEVIMWAQSTGASSKMVYSIDDLLPMMFNHVSTARAWELMSKSAFDAIVSPPVTSPTPPPMVAPNDDRRTKQRKRFDELMRPVLDYQMLYYSERGMYCNIAHTFVIWNPNKNGFEAYNNGHLNMLYQLDDALVVMFSTCPDFNTWKAMHKSDYDKLVKSKHQKPTPTLSVDVDAVMHDMGIGDDDEYLDEGVRYPFGGGNGMDDDDDDMTDEERAILAREIEMIDNDFAEYNAQQKAQTSAPPKDFNHPLVFDKSSPEYLLAYAVMVAMESTGKDKARHVALMLTKITGYEIANWQGNWSDVVGEWHMEFSEAVADMVASMFNRLDDLGSKL